MKYLLTFKPLKHFFFGNDRTFSDDYLAVSEYFPQNTQLLGALRLYIAEQKKLMKVYLNGKWCSRPRELISLTGSATSSNFQNNDDLGKIKNLSQMFLVDHALNEAYFPTPFDIEISKDGVKYYDLLQIGEEYFLSDYDIKKASSQMLANGDFWSKYIQKDHLSLDDIKPFDTIFRTHTQVGIELKNKQTVENKFYSKVDYQLEEGYLFACLFEFEDDIEDGIIQIGAESSIFELKVHKLGETMIKNHPVISRLFTEPQKGDKVVALSDVMLNTTDDLNGHFTIVPYYKNFAMIKTYSHSQKGRSKDKNNKKFKGKTEQKRIIPAGTVSYVVGQNMPFHQNLGAFGKMGYNQFITVKN